MESCGNAADDCFNPQADLYRPMAPSLRGIFTSTSSTYRGFDGSWGRGLDPSIPDLRLESVDRIYS